MSAALLQLGRCFTAAWRACVTVMPVYISIHTIPCTAGASWDDPGTSPWCCLLNRRCCSASLERPLGEVAHLPFCCILSVAALGYFRRSHLGRGPCACEEEGRAHIQTGHSRTVHASSDICVQITQNRGASTGFSLLQTLAPFMPAVPLLGKNVALVQGTELMPSVPPWHRAVLAGYASPPGSWQCVGAS